MQRPAGDNDLSPADRDRLRALTERYRQTGVANGPVSFDGLLPDPNDLLYDRARRHLIKYDLAQRWRNGRPVYIEDYLKLFPDIAANTAVVTDLLFEEYTVRRKHGDRPLLSGYGERFPGRLAELEIRIRGEDDPSDILPAADPRQTGALLPVFGGYRLIKRIGRGSYGEVWQAEAPGGIDAAIKVIFRPLQHAVAQRELESLELVKRLRHPYLLQTQAFWSLEDRLIIAMELADGSLQDRLRDRVAAGRPGIPVEELLVHTGEACEALDFLHAKKVLHRDIKPENVLLLQGHVKVADFGLARLAQSPLASTTVRGTPAFMAPEVWKGRPVEASDQYSLACSYAALRLNRHPFPGKDIPGMMLDHFERAPDLELMDRREQEVVGKALEKDPAKRYANCREFSDALREAIGPAAAVPAGLPRSSEPPGATPTGRGRQSTLQSTSPGRTLIQDGLDSERLPRPPSGQSATEEAEARAGLPGAKPVRRRRRRPRFGVALILLAVVAGLLIAWFMPGPTLIPVIPAGCRPVELAGVADVGGRRAYKEVVRDLPAGNELVFLLILPTRPNDPPPFYILRDKVTYRDFTQFAKENPAAVQGSGWELGPNDAEGKPAGGYDSPSCPVVRVRWDEAAAFAHGLGGELPSAKQWDKAGGFSDDTSPWPFVGDRALPAEEGTSSDRLLPVDRPKVVQSYFGVRDMAGNCYEWTRSVKDDETDVPTDPTWNGNIIIRGAPFWAPDPYTFHKETPDSRPRRCDPRDPGPRNIAAVGFRVVLELTQRP